MMASWCLDKACIASRNYDHDQKEYEPRGQQELGHGSGLRMRWGPRDHERRHLRTDHDSA